MCQHFLTLSVIRGNLVSVRIKADAASISELDSYQVQTRHIIVVYAASGMYICYSIYLIIAYIIRVLGCISICIICVYIAIIVASICAFILGNQYKSGRPSMQSVDTFYMQSVSI